MYVASGDDTTMPVACLPGRVRARSWCRTCVGAPSLVVGSIRYLRRQIGIRVYALRPYTGSFLRARPHLSKKKCETVYRLYGLVGVFSVSVYTQFTGSSYSMKLRQSARKINIRKRFNALTSQEKMVSKRYYRIFYISLVKSIKSDEADLKVKYKKLAQWAYLKYLFEVVDLSSALPPPIRLDRTIDSFSESRCWNFF